MAQYSAAFVGRAHTALLTLSEGAKDVAAKKVRINYTLEILKGVNKQTWNNGSPGNQPWSITLGGSVIANGSSFAFNFDSSGHTVAPGTRFTIASGSVQVPYGSNGSLHLSVAFSADADVWSGGSHGSGTKIMGLASYPPSGTVYFDPSDISLATQPTVTPKSAVVADEVLIGLPRANPAFTHDVTWVSGTLSGTIGTGLGTSVTWTVPNVTGEFPTQIQSPIQITAVTKNGATVIGTKSVTLMVWNTPPSIDPTITVPFDTRIRQVVWNGSRLKATTPIITTSLKLTDTASATPTVTVGTSGIVPGSDDDLDGKLVLLEVQNGSSWVSTDLLFVLSRDVGDDVDLTQSQSYSGMGFLDFELARGYLTADWKRTGSGTNAGSVIDNLITTGHAKGWGPNIAQESTLNKTSVGDGWQASGQTRELSGGTPYSQILEALVNDGWCEWRSRYDDTNGKCYLDIFNPQTGSDWTSSNSQVVVNLSTAKISSAPTTWSFEGVLDRVYAKGDADTRNPSTSADNVPGIVASSERTPYDANVFGYLEGWTSASGQTTTASIRSVAADALANATLTLSRSFSYSAFAVSRNLLPYYTFKPGDWILVPSDRNKTADPISMRVTQIVIDKTSDGITITVTCGDLIPASASASAIKKIKASTGGSISGGTLKDPVPLQAIIPAAPDFANENAATSAGYWDTHGIPRALIEFSWLPVTVALDGVTPVDVDYYEVWWRPDPSVEWVQKTFSLTTSVEMDDWAVDFTAQFKVRARSSGGVLGVFSAWDEVTTAEPTASIDPLAVALLYTDGLGTIFADWSGLLADTSGLPSYFAYMNAEISPDDGTGLAPTGVWTVKGNSLASTGTVTINPGDFGTWWVRFRAYDALGGPGIDGTPSSITTSDPHIAPPVPAPPTSLSSTPGAAWDASGFLPEAWFDLSWTAPTLDTDGNPVEIVGYDVFGLRTGEAIERYLTSTTTTGARISVGNGEEWSFRVKATSNYGGVSVFSDQITDTADATISAASAPSAPTLAQYAGILQIKWAGGGMVPQIKYVYALISTTLGGTYTRAGMPLIGAGEVDVPGLAPGDYYAKIAMVDELGQVSVSAASAAITLLPITGVTIQTSELANTGIKMTTAGITAYDATGNPTFILNAGTGEVWIAPYAAVIDLGASGTLATTGASTTGIAISAENSSFNTFINPYGLQIRNDQTPVSWWEADSSDSGLVNFFSPRVAVGTRLKIGDMELLNEAKTTGSRLVMRYKGL